MRQNLYEKGQNETILDLKNSSACYCGIMLQISYALYKRLVATLQDLPIVHLETIHCVLTGLQYIAQTMVKNITNQNWKPGPF